MGIVQIEHVFGQACCTSTLSQWLPTLSSLLFSQSHPFAVGPFRTENIIDVSEHNVVGANVGGVDDG